MAPTKKFAKYAEKLAKAIGHLENPTPKEVAKALKVLHVLYKDAVKRSTGATEAKSTAKKSNYILFCQEKRAKAVAELGPGAGAKAVMIRLAEMWQLNKATWKPKASTLKAASKSKSSASKASPKKEKSPAKAKKEKATATPKPKKEKAAAKPKKEKATPKPRSKKSGTPSFYDFF
jgi:hypothetical protein